MNAAHLHLIVNHLPVVGVLLAFFGLVLGLIWPKLELKTPMLGLMVVACFLALPAYFSGEGAEHLVEGLAGVKERMIEQHEDLAATALLFTQITGILGLVALALRNRIGAFKSMYIATLVAGAVTLTSLGLTANSGGKIRHPEIDGTATAQNTRGQTHEIDHDDDD